MGGGLFSDGIQAVATLYPRGTSTQVIYVAGSVEYCTRVYETPHMYFLLRPVQTEQMHQALACAVANLREREAICLPVTVSGTVMRLPASQIIFLESRRRKVHIVMADRTVTTYGKLSDMAAQLPTSFVRTHMSFLVNMDYLDCVDRRTAHLATGEVVPVSRQRSAAARETFLHYLKTR